MDCVDCKERRYCDIQGSYLREVFFAVGSTRRVICVFHRPETFRGVEGVTA